MEKKEKKTLSITFYTKQKATCPICKKQFAREELLSGGGRLIAGDLTDELRRTYQPSMKYGVVYPLIYSLAVCPNCNSAMLWADMNDFDDQQLADALIDSSEQRAKSVEAVFPHFNFTRERTLIDGCAAYYLALLCYEKFPAKYSPTIKKAQICLRLAWMSDDLDKVLPNRNYDYLKKVFYQKAHFFYEESLNLEMTKKENITGLSNFGPDLDKNYGYDGVVYLSCLLEYKYGQTSDINLRLKKLENAKHSIARIFGLGKSSKNKPGPLLEHSRALYDKLSSVLKDAHVVDVEEEEEVGKEIADDSAVLSDLGSMDGMF